MTHRSDFDDPNYGPTIEGLFKAIQQCEERGDFRSMRGQLKYWERENVVDRLKHHDDLRAFAKLLMRVIKAIDIEHKRGAGSLMKWDHPVNQMMVSRGFLKMPPGTKVSSSEASVD